MMASSHSPVNPAIVGQQQIISVAGALTLGRMPGCIFDYFGRIPESAYAPPERFDSPLEQAVYDNDVERFTQLVQEGHEVSVRLKIGKMSCLEFAAMKGYSDILPLLMSRSVCASALRQYFSLDDIVERAYLISKNKSVFFGQEALAEANRYVAALYTAIAYNQPRCVELLLNAISRRDAAKHSFYVADAPTLQSLEAAKLAHTLGHTECYKLVTQWRGQSTVPLCR
jgi:hypothetical protein